MFNSPTPTGLVLTSAIAMLSASFTSPAVASTLFTAKSSTEVVLTFQSQVELSSFGVPSQSAAKSKIDEQVNHLFGPMGVADYPGVPKGNHKITNVQISKKFGFNDLYVATYSYEGTALIKNGPTSSYTVYLPTNPDKIYAAGAVSRFGQTNYPCTDHHYQSEGDFWYFWNPSNPGCPLKAGRDYLTVQAKIERLPNMVVTYPEYNRLVDSNGTISISVLMGMDDPSKSRNPLQSNDVNASNYRDLRSSLMQMGFQGRTWTTQEILATGGGFNSREVPFVEQFEKSDAKAKIVIRMFFAPTGISESSKPFHYFFKDALANSSVMMYDGHSGLGGHLDLSSIERREGFKFEPNQDRYQMYFFNSCSSYTYYNTLYFGRKKTAADPNGTKNLDILNNGLSTYFSVMSSANLVLIKAIDLWALDKDVMSYQDIAKAIDSDNLFAVNGDEDNSTNAPK